MADWLENVLVAAKMLPERQTNANIDNMLAGLNGSLPEQLNQGRAQSIGQILAYKDAYKKAQDEYDNMMKVANDANSTATAKAAAQARATAAQQTMADAHKGADFTRKVAANRGYDLGNYDAYNTSLDDANVNFATEGQQAIDDIFNKDLTIEQYYDRAYRELRDQGVWAGQARRIAQQRAREYGIDRQARFNTAMQMYGRGGNGELTDLGMQLIGKFSGDFPELANMYGSAYATPQKQYEQAMLAEREQAARNQAAALAMYQDSAAWDKMLEQALINSAYADQQHKYALELGEQKYNNQSKRDEQLYRYDLKRDELQNKRKAEEKREAEAIQAEKWKRNVNNLRAIGVDQPTAELIANGISIPKSENKTEKINSVPANVAYLALQNEDTNAAVEEIDKYLNGEGRKEDNDVVKYLEQVKYWLLYRQAVEEGNREGYVKYMQKLDPSTVENITGSGDIADYIRRERTKAGRGGN